MCAISGSFDINEVKLLYNSQLNRGNKNSSFTQFVWKEACVVKKVSGVLSDGDFVEYTGETESPPYYITHSQAPTGTTGDNNIHPSAVDFMWGGKSYMWHNGVIPQKSMQELNKQLHTDFTWDTRIIHHMVMGYIDLSSIDGSFACLFVTPEKDLFVFRNEQSPLFMNKDMTFSSTKFEKSAELPPNALFYVNPIKRELIHTGVTFKSNQPLYYFGD
jgi:hypothetical protein